MDLQKRINFLASEGQQAGPFVLLDKVKSYCIPGDE